MAIMCMALIGIAIMLTEIHRYMVYKAEIEQEERMEGLCKNCGQMHLVSAETQEEADRIASESCDCENEAKWHRMMEENVEMLCGEQSRNLNFIPLDDTSLRYVKTTCELIHAGFISNAKFSAANSEIKINGVAGKVDIKRTKKQTNQMTI